MVLRQQITKNVIVLEKFCFNLQILLVVRKSETMTAEAPLKLIAVRLPAFLLSFKIISFFFFHASELFQWVIRRNVVTSFCHRRTKFYIMQSSCTTHQCNTWIPRFNTFYLYIYFTLPVFHRVQFSLHCFLPIHFYVHNIPNVKTVM